MALPKSLLFFAATGAVFLLQLFPYTGVFLMFLLAPFWPVVLVNLGFIGIALEAASGQVTRLWLILPTAWFGAYTWFAVADHGALERLQHDIAAANDSVRVTFNPSQQALVITDASDPQFLVTNYALSVVYVRNTNRAGSSRAAVRMVETEVCAKVRAGRSLSAAGIYTHGFHEGRLLERRFCVLRLPEDPTLPEVTVEVDTRRATEGGLPVTLTTTTVTTSDGARHVLRGGHAAPLRWFPMPVIGCSLNSAAASWDCIAEFNRRRFTPLQIADSRYGSDTIVLARALGLSHVSPADRRAPDPEQVQATLNAAVRRVVDAETANLDRVLADVSANVGSVPFGSLHGRQGVILPRLDRIVAKTEHGIAVRGGRGNAQQMFRLIEQVPPAALEPYRTRLDALKDKDAWFVFRLQ